MTTWKDYWERRIIEAVAFRRSEDQAKHVGRMAVWLRLGELDMHRKQCAPFNKRKFEVALRGVRAATTQGPVVFEPMLDNPAECGVVVSLIKEIPGAGISGATRWHGRRKAQLQLSLRYKTDDQFWFTFFHEAGHILLHDKEDMFLEPNIRTARTHAGKEDEADQFAADFLIPSSVAASLPTLQNRDRVIAFAERLGIAPGIVVGRLQHDGHITPRLANYWGLKRRLDWTD